MIAEFGVATAIDLALVLLALIVVAPATWVLADRTPVTPTVPAGGGGTGGTATRQRPSSTLARDGRTTLG